MAEKNGEYKKFVSTTLRPSKRGIFQESLAHFMSLSVPAEPLKKIRLICEATLLLEKKQLKKLEINIDLVNRIHIVCTAFSSAAHYPRFYVYQIAWGFLMTVENFTSYIQPWLTDRWLDFIASYSDDGYPKVPRSIIELLSKRKLSGEEYTFLFKYLTQNRLSVKGFNMLRNQFVRWALPKTQQFFRKLTSLVSPDLYKDILSLQVKGETEHARNVGQR